MNMKAITATQPQIRSAILLTLTTALVLFAFVLMVHAVFAHIPDPEKYCFIQMGTWDSVENTCTTHKADFVNSFKGNLWNAFTGKFCGESNSTTIVLKFSDQKDPYAVFCNHSQAESIALGINISDNVKTTGVDSSILNKTKQKITATFKGYPAYLRLKDGNKYYLLPVIPDSISYEGGGAWMAEFYTADPATGEALAPTGTYYASVVTPTGKAGGDGEITLNQVQTQTISQH